MGAILWQGAVGREPEGWADILRHDVAPVGRAFVVFVLLLVAFHRAGTRLPAHRPAGRAPVPEWPDLIRHLVGTTAGGYLFFLVVVLVFYLFLGGEDASLVTDALVGGSLLAFLIASPSLLGLAALFDRGERRRAVRSRPPRARDPGRPG